MWDSSRKTDFQSIPKLTNQYFSAACHATNSVAKTKGVSILISKNLPITITEVLDDKEGRFIFVKDSLYDRPITKSVKSQKFLNIFLVRGNI